MTSVNEPLTPGTKLLKSKIRQGLIYVRDQGVATLDPNDRKMPALRAAAEIISYERDPRGKVEDTVWQAIRLAYGGRPDIIEQLDVLFGIAPGTRNVDGPERTERAFALSGKGNSNSFRTGTVRRFYDRIETAVSELVARPELRAPEDKEAESSASNPGEDETRDYRKSNSAEPEPNNAPSVGPPTEAEPPPAPISLKQRYSLRTGWRKFDGWWKPVALFLAAFAMTFGIGWVYSHRHRTKPTRQSLSQLEVLSAQRITSMVPGPDDYATSDMGFGDSWGHDITIDNPGATYRLDADGRLLNGPKEPTLNSVVNETVIGDERRFLSVVATPLTDARQLKYERVVDQNKHTAKVTSDDVVWVIAKIYNNANGLWRGTCRDASLRPDARNVRLRMKISPNGKRQVIRAWLLMESGGQQTWQTDAVAIDTASTVTLTPDRKISRQSAWTFFAPWSVKPSLNANAVLDETGMLVGDHGKVYGCNNDMGLTVMLGLRQR